MSSRGNSFFGLSPFRKHVVELMRLSHKIPLVTAERKMNLAELIGARAAASSRPHWSVILCKAFALVAARRPELRRAYMSYPWPHLYENPSSIASIIVERDVDGEEVPMQFRLRNLESTPLVGAN